MIDIIVERLPVTIELAVIAMIFASTFGILFGIIAAYWHNSSADVGVMVGLNVIVGVGGDVRVNVANGTAVSVGGIEVAVAEIAVGVASCPVDGVQAVASSKTSKMIFNLISFLPGNAACSFPASGWHSLPP